jgi:hypothetical protein
MTFVDLLVGVLMIAAGIALFRHTAPVDGKANPRVKPWVEPYLVVVILGLIAFGTIMIFLGVRSTLG